MTIHAHEEYNVTSAETVVIASLEINNVDLLNDGHYELFATNGVSEESIVFQLNVMPYALTTTPADTSSAHQEQPTDAALALLAALVVCIHF